MLSQDELFQAIENSIFPKLKEVEQECLSLYNKMHKPGRGAQPFTGSNELDFSIVEANSIGSYLEHFRENYTINKKG